MLNVIKRCMNIIFRFLTTIANYIWRVSTENRMVGNIIYFGLFYSIIGLIALYVIFMLYVKIKYHFWAIQPVFHTYDIFYWFMIPFIIKPNHSGKKYVNFLNTKHITFEELALTNNGALSNVLSSFIQEHYLKTDLVSYTPSTNNILSHFKDNGSNFIFYYLDNILIGCITSRLINVYVNNDRFRVFYVDYLCVHNDYRKKGVAPELIETITYYQNKYNEHNKKDYEISLFKKETKSHWIIDVVTYSTYMYDIESWDLSNYKENLVSNNSILVEIGSSNIGSLLEILRIQKENTLDSAITKQYAKNKKNANNCITTMIINDDEVIIKMITMKILKVYLLVNTRTSDVEAVYSFKDSSTFYDKKPAIEVNSCLCLGDQNLFVSGFYHALYKIRENGSSSTDKAKTNKINKTNNLNKINKTNKTDIRKNDKKYSIMLFETISDNNIIRNNFLYNRKICFGKVPCSFYFYNYASKSVKPKNTFIML